MARKPVKVGVKVGGGPAPGYKWNVEILDVAYKEAMGFLDDDQYDHLANQVKELASGDDPTHSETISIDQIEEFHELRDWGGILHPFSVRVFFGVDKEKRSIVILGTLKKQNNGATPAGDKIVMRRRWRNCLKGEYD